MRILFSFTILLAVKLWSCVFWRRNRSWVGEPIEDPWADIRLVAFLNHTSLYEPVFASHVPHRFLWRLASRGVLPVASKTLDRPLVGKLFKLFAREVVSISREPDHTWQDVLRRVRPGAMIIMAPEGRMKRANGLDKDGRPMTVRGGIADILKTMPDEGRFLIAYSGGLHHVQVPGQTIPRLFSQIHMAFESIDVAVYRRQIVEQYGRGEVHFKAGVKHDLERRRDLYTGGEPAP